MRFVLAAATFSLGVAASLGWQHFNSARIQVNVINPVFKAHDIENARVYLAVLRHLKLTEAEAVIGESAFHEEIEDVDSFYWLKSIVFKETVRDFQRKSTTQVSLTRYFGNNSKVTFISTDEEIGLFRKSDGWDKFKKKYPRAKKLIHFSNVGFNQTQTEALVAVGIDRAVIDKNIPLRTDTFAQLIKVDGTWYVYKIFHTIVVT